MNEKFEYVAIYTGEKKAKILQADWILYSITSDFLYSIG